MTRSLLPFLMFQGNATEAFEFYKATFPSAVVEAEERKDGKLHTGRLKICGQTIIFFESPTKHAFTFTPSFSFFVEIDSPKEVTALAETLKVGGKVFMPADTYDFAQRFAWIQDRFGISWQLSCR